MGGIAVGVCGWTDPALVRSGWYPSGSRDAEGRLRYYAERFPVVEADATYYALPSARNSELWAARTPPGFRFDVKAFSLLTGHPTRAAALPADLRPAFARGPRNPRDADPALLDEIWGRFSGALEPLRSAGRLGALLFQFPPWLAPGARAEEFIGRCAERTDGWPVAVEFRHPAWWQRETADRTEALLSGLGMAAVAVDMTQTLPASVPPVTPVTSPDTAVVRFHGRSTAWGTGSKEDRYRHAYSTAELTEWLPRIRSLADRADTVHVLFNNCCGDAAVRAAETMQELLSEAVR
ncbi:DUF72 domain-containing protein [Streptomyces purpurogeneiscleroticus]|uniref:DUF72 domain-containing protein n=1 Tax=Streptomyces purpurogeneiscleroticus TaxID=68259 RepID=UPI001CC0E857|nr:DUF72 domain-containing protein [Streptomyces purpurogeneiscleroticus]MBZ4014393.1 hypothetical protein [Streptomyces purpurogeneiscleroticus]